MKALFSGNEAVERGWYVQRPHVATTYPRAPSGVCDLVVI